MSAIKQTYFLDFYNNLVDGNKDKCSAIVQSLLDEGADLKDIYVELFQNSLYRIGKLWDHNKLTVSEEHLATQITAALVSKFAPPSPVDSKNKVVVACIDKEFHELGARMVSHVFEMANWKTTFLALQFPQRRW